MATAKLDSRSSNQAAADAPVTKPGPSEKMAEPLACVSCRSRKLKCDRTKPACARCIKNQADCVYPEFRRKPAFKRRNVKELEARLAQVEEYLKEVNKGPEAATKDQFVVTVEDEHMTGDSQNSDEFDFNTTARPKQVEADQAAQPPQMSSDSSLLGSLEGGWAAAINGTSGDDQLMELGRSEALPPFAVMEELNSVFFAQQHYHIPIIHPANYLRAFYGPPMQNPPMGLQYIIWATAAVAIPKYMDMADIFYQRARNYGNNDEMRGNGEYHVDVAHAQLWILVAGYEAKRMFYTRAAISTAKAVRLVNMLGLEKIDDDDSLETPVLGPASSWSELEERRRTFWGAYAIDSHARIATGWPSLLKESDIFTRLPASEDAFVNGTIEDTGFLEQIDEGLPYSGFSGTIMLCHVYKQVLEHVHKPRKSDRPQDLKSGPFWSRHRDLDNKISSIFMFLPPKMLLPQNRKDPSAVHTNMNLHAALIALHHAAIEQIDKHELPESLKARSVARLKGSMDAIVSILRMVASSPSMFKNPMTSMSLYLAVTVIIYLAGQSPEGASDTDRSNMEIMIRGMEAIARHHVVTQTFLKQALMDIEQQDMSGTFHLPQLQKYRNLSEEVGSNALIARNPAAVRAVPHQKSIPWTTYGLPTANTALQPGGSGGENDESSPKTIIHMLCCKPLLASAGRNMARHNKVKTMPWNRLGHVSPTSAPSSDQGVGDDHLGSSSSKMYTAPLWAGQPEMPTFAGGGLPDRTAPSSKSSPRNLGMATETSSGGASETSPDPAGGNADRYAGVAFGLFNFMDDLNVGNGFSGMSGTSNLNGLSLGLGNTAEENRVDLREMQGRVQTPLWPGSTAEDDIFGQITDTMVSDLSSSVTYLHFLHESAMDWSSNGGQQTT